MVGQYGPPSVKGLIGAHVYTLASLFASNTAQARFVVQALDNLETFAEGILILGGDLNFTLDPRIAHS